LKRLSIIVPVYNIESYLAKCLDSLLTQDIPYEEYEIIIVNDGSTDNSLAIAEKYQHQYNNIKLISQPNKCLGGARNTGIGQAEGKCLFFVDSDDYIQPNSLNDILNTFEQKELEVLRFNHESVTEDGTVIQKRKNAIFNIVFSNEVVDGETFLSEQLGWACYVWAFLFDTQFIKEHFLFQEHLYFEDVEWLVRVLSKAKRVCSINTTVYYYLQRSGSITQSILPEKKNKVLNDKLYMVDFLKSTSKNATNSKVKKWCNGSIALMFMGILTYVENDLPERKKEVFNFIRERKLIPFHSCHFTIKQRRDLYLMNLSPKSYCYLRKK
jgi:glycosyltransferase involved in cell wall biosynthesis